MNCPTRDETEALPPDNHNQQPPSLAGSVTTNEDLNGRANRRTVRGGLGAETDETGDSRNDDRADVPISNTPLSPEGALRARRKSAWAQVEEVAVGTGGLGGGSGSGGLQGSNEAETPPCDGDSTGSSDQLIGHRRGASGVSAAGRGVAGRAGNALKEVLRVLKKYVKFVGPGFMVAVAYIDPGNYATDVAAGASYRFRLLFIILMSNVFAIFLQSLCIKLGSVTGMNLAENCKAHLPRWLNYVLYGFAEAAIIATDIAEVIGTAIALNVLLKIPLVAGCAISIIDVLIILFFYNPAGTMRSVRYFEAFVALLVLGVVICFILQLAEIKDTAVGDVFKGYLPSSAIFQAKGLYQSCGILGATVMPHSLYLGSGIVQSRLHEFDVDAGYASKRSNDPDLSDSFSMAEKYRPSLAAIKSCMSYSIAELAISLFTFALFVNSAILIVAGASLYGTPGAEEADLFGIHDLLSSSLSPAAGTIFMLALLLSGTSAGIVCTIAGQMVSEGQLNWTVKPWVRRLITRSISITPSIIIAGALGREGLSHALEGSQVALSIILPFVSAPLLWFTCRSQYMKVIVRPRIGDDGERVTRREGQGDAAANPVDLETQYGSGDVVQMRNGWYTATIALLIWGIIVVMNVALLVLTGLGLA